MGWILVFRWVIIYLKELKVNIVLSQNWVYDELKIFDYFRYFVRKLIELLVCIRNFYLGG